MNKELIERIALEVAKEMPAGFLWDEECGHDAGVLEPEVCYFADKFLARIDAERGKEAVHWRGVLDAGQVPQQLNASLHVVGFRKLRDAESFVTSKLALDGWRYTLEPLFLSPTIQGGMALVPVNEIQSVKVHSDFKVIIQVTSCRAACAIKARIAAAQGERNGTD